MRPDLPLVAILRGLGAEEAAEAGRALLDAGLRLLEVPLNRPGALDAIAELARIAPADALIGGGTMTRVADVAAVAAAGGRLCVAPNMNPDLIRAACAAGMWCAPGVATPTEAFAALDAGAHALKVFPGEMVTPRGLRAMRTVLPAATELWPVGGVDADNFGVWLAHGATGFGIGSALYSPGVGAQELGRRARRLVEAWHAAREARP